MLSLRREEEDLRKKEVLRRGGFWGKCLKKRRIIGRGNQREVYGRRTSRTMFRASGFSGLGNSLLPVRVRKKGLLPILKAFWRLSPTLEQGTAFQKGEPDSVLGQWDSGRGWVGKAEVTQNKNGKGWGAGLCGFPVDRPLPGPV